MKRRFLRSLILAAPLSLALTGCQSALPSSPTSSPDPSDGSYSNVNPEWPLYRGFPHGADSGPSPSVASYGRPLEKLLSAGRGPIPNFPSPAKVTWRSKDGTSHEAEIDIGEIFKDQLIRHNLKQDEISEDGIGPGALPSIILEVKDRTINVYMRAHTSTKELQKPGNKHSDFRNDLIKVFSQHY
jgi:hypothetical protein